MATDDGTDEERGVRGVLRWFSTRSRERLASDGGEPTAGVSGGGTDPPTEVAQPGGDVPEPGSGVDSGETDVAELRARLEAERERREEAEAKVREERERREEAEAKVREERERRTAVVDAVEEIAADLEAASAGDLGVEFEADSDVAGIDRLARAAGELVAELSETIDRAEQYSTEILTATGHVRDHVEDVKADSKNVSNAVESISSGAETQNERIDEMSDEMQHLSAMIEEIAASADDLATRTDETAARGDEGQQAAQQAVDELDELVERIEQTVTYVEELDDRIEEIETVVSFINDVAEQTNILALNANIEAARAGEAGAGFEVVASEVKELANETQEATDDIRDSLDDVQSQADRTVSEIHDTNATVERSLETIQTALDALEGIVEDVDEVNDGVQEISDATDTQATTTQEVVDMTEEVGEISEQTADEASRVADAVSDQTVNIAEATGRVDTLEERTNSLQDLFEAYAVGGGRSVGAAGTDSDVTVVSFWHALGEDKARLLNEMAREFEAQTDGIAVEPTAHGSYPATFDASLSAVEDGDPPTITHVWEVGTKKAIDSGAFAPVEEVLPADVDFEQYLDPVVNYYRADGELYAMPFNSSNPILCYDKGAFERAGLDPEWPPGTFDGVTETSRQLVSDTTVDYGITFGNHSWFVEQWFAEQDAELVDERNGRAGTATEASLDSEAGRNVYEWWTSIDEEGLYYNPVDGDRSPREVFFDGEAAMYIDTTSSLRELESGADEAGIDMGTGPLPVYDERNGVVVGGGSLWVAADVSPEVRSAAGEFLAWITEPEQQVRWHRNTGCFPVRREAIDSLRGDGWFEANPHYETAFEQLQNTIDTPATNGARVGPFNTVRTIIEEGFGDMHSDNIDDVLSRTNDQIERRLVEYRAESGTGR